VKLLPVVTHPVVMAVLVHAVAEYVWIDGAFDEPVNVTMI
jgi:hypothetical protein